ncbi:DUF4232 domain-containing protein [Streptomyces spiramenti]|uniref:DUF4232 domain-containing protein n=1 Tax=Streptomyces spiramenti TaxID=2720606 RepID=A0ABX1AK66_9ACTN|nr:DUF4232 domain-containing protein [Streptomyces spiramenti]NJP67508.1 DUF4232 domain-containing protein [Streptomyces spiramenti]
MASSLPRRPRFRTAVTVAAAVAALGVTTGVATAGGASGASTASPAPAGAPVAVADEYDELVLCEGSNTEVTAEPLERPLNRLLLTATNTGDSNCVLLEYPSLWHEGAQAVPPAFEESRPASPVVLAPGESGYASVALSATDGSGGDGTTYDALTVGFSLLGHGSYGQDVALELPEGGVHIDDSLTVTYWLDTVDDAVIW